MRALPSCQFIAPALAAAPSLAGRGTVERPVPFANGKSGTTIEGSLTPGQVLDYAPRTAAGQTITVGLSGGSGVNSDLLPPGFTGEARFVGSRDGNRAANSGPAGGECTLRLYPMGSAAKGGLSRHGPRRQ